MRKFLALCAVAALACNAGTSESGLRSRVVLGFGSILGGDFVSVLDTAYLGIIRGEDIQQTLAALFGSGDSETSFDVTLEPGPVTFAVLVKSTNGTTLYSGQTNSTIDADGFSVTITPQPVSAVLVVAPAKASYVIADNGQIRTVSTTLRIRNAGSANLTWRVDSLITKPAQVTMFCTDFNDNDCRTNQIRLPNLPERTIGVGFSMPSGFPGFTPPATLRFISSVGNVTTRP